MAILNSPDQSVPCPSDSLVLLLMTLTDFFLYSSPAVFDLISKVADNLTPGMIAAHNRVLGLNEERRLKR